jgi:hypothetical protein
MAQPWSQVVASPGYQALPPDQQEAARQQYFEQVVSPQLPDDNARAAARQQFDAATKPGPSAKVTPQPGDVVVRPTPDQLGQGSFDKSVQQAVQQANAEDAAGPSLGQRIGDAVVDFGNAERHHLGNAVTGIAQLVGHGITGAANALLPADSDARAMINTTNRNADQAIAQRESAYQAQTPNTPAAYSGAAMGEVAPWLLEAPAKGLQTVGNIATRYLPESLPLLRKIVSGAVQGGTVAATQPVTSGPSSDLGSLVSGQPSFAQQKAEQVGLGTLTGGAVPLASSAVGNIASLGRHVLSPGTIAAQNIVQKFGATPEVLAQLDAAASPVPGVKLTSAQAAPSPGAVGAEKAAANTPAFKEALTQRGNVNNAARVQAVQDLAGDDASYQAAQAARANAPLSNGQTVQQFQRETLPNASVDPSSVLKAIASVRNSGLGARPTISSALDQIENAITKRVDEGGNISADVLDSIRQNANDFLVSPSGKQASAQEKAGVTPIKSQIIDALDDAVPGYRNYLSTFADKSVPLNTMDAARAILDRADNRPLNSAGAAPLSLTDINRGLASIEKGRYGVSPEAQQTLEGIQDSLKREGISNSLPKSGSDTLYNINADKGLPSAILGPNLGGPTTKVRGGAAALGALIGSHFGGLPGGSLGAGLGAFINKGADVINSRIMDQYTKGLLNPEDAATMIRTYLRGNPAQASKLLSQYPQWNALLSSQSARAVTPSPQPQPVTSP